MAESSVVYKIGQQWANRVEAYPDSNECLKFTRRRPSFEASSYLEATR